MEKDIFHFSSIFLDNFILIQHHNISDCEDNKSTLICGDMWWASCLRSILMCAFFSHFFRFTLESKSFLISYAPHTKCRWARVVFTSSNNNSHYKLWPVCYLWLFIKEKLLLAVGLCLDVWRKKKEKKDRREECGEHGKENTQKVRGRLIVTYWRCLVF